MKILVTGGTGVIGQGVLAALLDRGHSIRLLSRDAERDAREWPGEIEPMNGDVGDPMSVVNKADGCDAIIHIAGISAETPDDTFERVNIGGTRNMLSEARRAGVKRFVHMSSLGADRGESDYQQSKRASEQLVRESGLEWTILRPGSVYGPGDEVISLLLKMIRALPAIPVIERGEQQFQPIWYGDLGEAVALVVERNDVNERVLELAGIENTSMNDLTARIGAITGRTPLQIPVPQFLAEITTKAAGAFGIDVSIDQNKLAMLAEENVVHGENALIGTLGIKATPLNDGLRMLSESLPEKLPEQGIGPLRQKRFWVDLDKSVYNRQELFERFRTSFSEAMPLAVHVEGESPRRLEEGATISMKLPLRGNIQVRVEKVTTSTIVLSTLEGHPVAGFVRFDFRNHQSMIHFEIRVVDRSGSFFDFFAMETVGQFLQDRAWEAVTEYVIKESGGAPVNGIEREEKILTGEEAHNAEMWAQELVIARKRKARTP